MIKLLLLTSLNDIYQEFFGKLCGKTKITKISPNKTLEGYLYGYLCSVVLNKLFLNTKIKKITKLYLSGIIGDLYFSFGKRLLKIKDYSNVLLDHGGILDRYDSLIYCILFNNF